MSINDRIRRVEDRIADACAKAGRDPSEITIVAVSKLKSPAEIISAVEAGLQHIGENRVEEAEAKIPQVNERTAGTVTWHMVGHVQSRKAKQVLPLFDVVHSVDSLRLARRLSRFALEQDRHIDILLEVNVSGEASKYGLAGYNWYQDGAILDQLRGAAGDIAALPNLRVNGLMTMAPYQAEEAAIRRIFADLYGLRETLANSMNLPLPELSMGMTDDYPLAIEEGATIVRIGRAIFGERIISER